jgi:hypothetical protein
VVAIGVIEAVFGAKEEGGHHKQPGQDSENKFDIHSGS